MKTFELLVSFLSKITSEPITMESTLKELHIDSIDIAEVLFSLEEECNIKFEDKELLALKTVSDVCQLMDTKEREKGN